jgi:cell division protein FtsA
MEMKCAGVGTRSALQAMRLAHAASSMHQQRGEHARKEGNRTVGEILFTGIDIGSTTTKVVMGQHDREQHLHIIGVATAPTFGVRRGGITNLNEVAGSIALALERVSHQTGRRPMHAVAAITGAHLVSANHRATIAITPMHRDIDEADVAHVLDLAGSTPVEAHEMQLAIIPCAYRLDGQEGIKNPAGMAGYRLEAEVHVVTGAASAYQNLLKCARQATLEIEDVVVAGLASAEAVLAPSERELGTVVIDMGGETADVVAYVDGAPLQTFMAPLGGRIITEDVQHWLSMPQAVAEAVKLQYGAATPARVPAGERIDLGQFLPQSHENVSRRDLARVIEARVEQFMTLLRDEITRNGGARALAGGVVLTGGTAELPGLIDVAARVMRAPVRLGAPHSLYGAPESLLHPAFATVVGVLRWQEQALASALPQSRNDWPGRLWGAVQRLLGRE